MSKIAALPEKAAEASGACADLLREALAVAEAGDMRAVAICYVAKGHEVSSVYEAGGAYATLLGAATLLQHDILHGGDVPGIDG